MDSAERRNSMPNNPYMFNGSRTAPALCRKDRRGGYRHSARRRNRNRTRKNRTRK